MSQQCAALSTPPEGTLTNLNRAQRAYAKTLLVASNQRARANRPLVRCVSCHTRARKRLVVNAGDTLPPYAAENLGKRRPKAHPLPEDARSQPSNAPTMRCGRSRSRHRQRRARCTPQRVHGYRDTAEACMSILTPQCAVAKARALRCASLRLLNKEARLGEGLNAAERRYCADLPRCAAETIDWLHTRGLRTSLSLSGNTT